jgi:hypothetical protein
MNRTDETTISAVVSSSASNIDSWEDFETFYASLENVRGRWCFRGHRSANWKLESSLERLTSVNRDGIEAEKLLIRAFQRRAHHFISDLPGLDNRLEWLALMQHWGVATRLVDFTMSPYIALFFALNEFFASATTVADERTAAIWAVNHVTCKGIAATAMNQRLPGKLNISHATFLGNPELFNEIFFSDNPLAFVVPVQPFRLNERHAIQQGLFLCPSNVKLRFEQTLVQPDSLQRYLQHEGSLPHDTRATLTQEDIVRHNLRSIIRKANISEKGARTILPRLYSMNLNSASLFPDMQGYARSINEQYLSLQLLPGVEKQFVGFDCINEFGALG